MRSRFLVSSGAIAFINLIPLCRHDDRLTNSFSKGIVIPISIELRTSSVRWVAQLRHMIMICTKSLQVFHLFNRTNHLKPTPDSSR